MGAGPTLLFCVGATKAGTSWLYDHLAGHPDCHLRRIKELHYFDALERGGLRHAAQRMARERAEAGARRIGPERQRDMAAWQAVLDRGGEDLPAYLAYLTEGAGGRRLVADITPAYALLPEARLRVMARLLPDVRFLYLLRDPVARLWSQVRMMAERAAKAPSDVPALARRFLARLFAGEAEVETYRLDYAGAIARLTAAVAKDRLCIAFQDEVMTPAGMAGLWSFLGIGAGPLDLSRRVHEGVAVPMTLAEATAARAHLAPQYDAVERHFGRLPDSWRRSPAEMAA